MSVVHVPRENSTAPAIGYDERPLLCSRGERDRAAIAFPNGVSERVHPLCVNVDRIISEISPGDDRPAIAVGHETGMTVIGSVGRAYRGSYDPPWQSAIRSDSLCVNISPVIGGQKNPRSNYDSAPAIRCDLVLVARRIHDLDTTGSPKNIPCRCNPLGVNTNLLPYDDRSPGLIVQYFRNAAATRRELTDLNTIDGPERHPHRIEVLHVDRPWPIVIPYYECPAGSITNDVRTTILPGYNTHGRPIGCPLNNTIRIDLLREDIPVDCITTVLPDDEGATITLPCDLPQIF